jgi:Domain of unknown function (DUF4168)
MRRLMRPLAVAMVSVTALLWFPAAHAQSQAPKQPQGQPSSPAVSDQKLDAAAAAAQHVLQVQQVYQPRIEAAAPSDKERLTGEANNALTKAVTDQGLSVDEYLSILQLAQNDPDIRNRFVKRINPSGQ